MDIHPPSTRLAAALTVFLLVAGVAAADPDKQPPPQDAGGLGILAASNDSFASAIGVSLPSGTTADTTGATMESGEPAPCGTLGATVWYTLGVGSATTVTVDTFGSDYDTVVAVYTGSAVNALTLQGCNDDTLGLQSQVSFSANPGVTYRIQVGGFMGDTGNVVLHVNQCGGNDSQLLPCIAITAPYTNLQNTLGFTLDLGESQPCGSIGATAWYRFNPLSVGTYTASTFGSDFDTVVAVYASVNGVILPLNLGCNDDASGTLQSSVSFQGVPGLTYLIQVGGFSGATGNVAFSLA